jgi:hypothetical protein
VPNERVIADAAGAQDSYAAEAIAGSQTIPVARTHRRRGDSAALATRSAEGGDVMERVEALDMRWREAWAMVADDIRALKRLIAVS